MAQTLLPAMGGGQAANSQVTVTAPAGSQLVLKFHSGDEERIVETGVAENGQYVFQGLDVGRWSITASLNGESVMRFLDIDYEGQRFRYYLGAEYGLRPSSFDLAAYGVKGVDYQVVGDDDVELPEEQWDSCENWKIRLLSDGNLRCFASGRVDVFLAGGGAGGSPWEFNAYFGPGGGGGYTTTGEAALECGAVYPIAVGDGGTYAAEGGVSAAMGLQAEGGKPGVGSTGGAGGSGGGSGGLDTGKSVGGSDGSDGGSINSNVGGTGQHTTTREFGEADGKLYCSGGKCNNHQADDRPATPNSGNGGDGGYTKGSVGSSGIVVIRNARGG